MKRLGGSIAQIATNVKRDTLTKTIFYEILPSVMEDKTVKKKKEDVNSFSNRLGQLAGNYQEALNKKAQELEKTLQSPAADKKPLS